MTDPLLDPVRVWTPDDLLTALGGVEELIRFYDLTTRDGIQEIAACVNASMESADVTADLCIVADVVRLLLAKTRTIPAPTPAPTPTLSRWDFADIRGHMGALEGVSAVLRCA